MKAALLLKTAGLLLLLGTAVWAQSLGTTNLLEGPTAGSDSVVLAASGGWTARANDSWLHLGAANQSGTGSGNVIFTFDTNPGATRTGTLTIAGQMLTVTQASSTYVAITNAIALVSSGLSSPSGVAVDSAGNVYIADSANNAVKEWIVASNTVITLVSSGLSWPFGVAVDSSGNVYIADSGNSAIKEWIAASNTVITLVSSELYWPHGVAVDGVGNVYIADTDNNAIKEWIGASNTVTTLVSSELDYPYGVAVDGVGNVYIADTYHNAIKKWLAASNTVTTMVSSGLSLPSGVAVDGAGNVYIVNSDNNAMKEWIAAGNTVTTLVSSGLSYPYGVAVDGAGNVYIADSGNNVIKELPHIFMDPTAKVETAASGSDAFVVLPVTANLTGPFTPVSDSLWLTITGVTNGVVSFTFTANNQLNRTAHIALLGQSLAVTQIGPPNYSSLGTTNLLEGSPAGSDSVLLLANTGWTASTSDSWLHLSGANQSGTGNTNVIFAFDANPGATRTGTFTIAGQTLAVTQAGSTYVAITNATILVPPGLTSAWGLAVDGLGNVYVADAGNNAIKEWIAASNTVTTLVSTGLSLPYGVAVDGSGDVYIADSGNRAIKKWLAATNTVITLVSSGLSGAVGVAVDNSGNVYIAEDADSGIQKWTIANNTLTTVAPSGLSLAWGVAVDGMGNVYIADTWNNAIKEWLAASNTIVTVVSSGLNWPRGVAVDGSGNVYIADYGNSMIKEWLAASNTVVTLVSSGLNWPQGVAVDGAGNVYIADTSDNAIKELPRGFLDPTSKTEPATAGSDLLPQVLTATANLTGPFAPVSDSPWLTVTGVTNRVVSFSFTANNFANRTAHITLMGHSISVIQPGPPNYSFLEGRTNFLEGPTAGSESVVLLANSSWTATANDSWLHLSAANQSGTGNTNVIFTFDANPGAARTGTLTVAGQMLTVTQAGANYVAITNATTLVSSGLSSPYSVAVDASGNIFIADGVNNAIKEWIVASNSVITLVSLGLNSPSDVALDGLGNVYIADTGNNAIKEWIAASNTVTTLVSSGLSLPYGVAVDVADNVYIADTGNNAIKKWIRTSNTVTTLVSSGLSSPYGIAVDASGNVFIADRVNNAIKEWIAANNTVTTLVSSGLNWPSGVTVDCSGNVYIADTFNSAIKKWIAASNTVTALVSSGLSSPYGVAVDVARNVYIADTGHNAIKELPRAFVDPTAKTELALGGSDTFPVVVPATANLTGPFVPVSDSVWLTVTGVSNGVVSFAFTANNSVNRTAHITLLSQRITVTQLGPPNYSSLGTTNLLEGFTAGSESVVLVVNSNWIATANAIWLHLSAANQSGTGNTNVIFAFDANPGTTRTGTFTIAGQTLTVTQVSSNYVPITNATTLVSSGLSSPSGVAVDSSGNIYVANILNNTIKEWTAASNTLATLVSSGLAVPIGVAVDASANVYIADYGHNAIKQLTVANSNITTLVSSGLSSPPGVAVDGSGNVYIADSGNNAIKEWIAASNTVTTLVSSGLSSPYGVAVDSAGNVYIADRVNNAIKEWLVAGNTVTTLVSSGLSLPYGVAVDGSGNVYIVDSGNNAIKEWLAASKTLATLVFSGLSTPRGVAVDGSGNVYITDSGRNAIKELPHAFLDPTAKTEPALGGSDTLPVVLPTTANLTGPFAPVSDSSWLTITGVNNGVVSFTFNGNYSTYRTAHIALLGRSIAVNQPAITPPILTGCTTLSNGAFQIIFTNNQGASFTVWTTTNMSLSFTNWTLLGTPGNNGSGQYEFTDPTATNNGQRFYRVSSP
jgi:DNA-binding beta-propeller fold protein YncE